MAAGGRPYSSSGFLSPPRCIYCYPKEHELKPARIQRQIWDGRACHQNGRPIWEQGAFNMRTLAPIPDCLFNDFCKEICSAFIWAPDQRHMSSLKQITALFVDTGMKTAFPSVHGEELRPKNRKGHLQFSSWLHSHSQHRFIGC